MTILVEAPEPSPNHSQISIDPVFLSLRIRSRNEVPTSGSMVKPKSKIYFPVSNKEGEIGCPLIFFISFTYNICRIRYVSTDTHTTHKIP